MPRTVSKSVSETAQPFPREKDTAGSHLAERLLLGKDNAVFLKAKSRNRRNAYRYCIPSNTASSLNPKP